MLRTQTFSFPASWSPPANTSIPANVSAEGDVPVAGHMPVERMDLAQGAPFMDGNLRFTEEGFYIVTANIQARVTIASSDGSRAAFLKRFLLLNPFTGGGGSF